MVERKRHKTQKADFGIPMIELIEEDVDRHSLVSMAKHFVDFVNADGMHINFYTWQVVFAEELSHQHMEGIRDAMLELMEESFDESEVEHLNKCLKNKRKDYKIICLLYHRPNRSPEMVSFSLFTPFPSVGCYLDYMTTTWKSPNDINPRDNDCDTLSGRGIGLFLLRLAQAYIVRTDVANSPSIYVDAMNFTRSESFYSQLGFEPLEQKDFPGVMKSHRRSVNQDIVTGLRLTDALPKLLEELRPYKSRNCDVTPILVQKMEDAGEYVSVNKMKRDVAKAINLQVRDSSYTDNEIAQLCKDSARRMRSIELLKKDLKKSFEGREWLNLGDTLSGIMKFTARSSVVQFLEQEMSVLPFIQFKLEREPELDIESPAGKNVRATQLGIFFQCKNCKKAVRIDCTERMETISTTFAFVTNEFWVDYHFFGRRIFGPTEEGEELNEGEAIEYWQGKKGTGLEIGQCTELKGLEFEVVRKAQAKDKKNWSEFKLPDTVAEDDDDAKEQAQEEFEAQKEKAIRATYAVVSLGAEVFIDNYWPFKKKLEARKGVVLKALERCFVDGEVSVRRKEHGFVEREQEFMEILTRDRKAKKPDKKSYSRTAAAVMHKQLVAASNRDYDMRFQNNLERIAFVDLKKLKKGKDPNYLCIREYQKYYPKRKDTEFWIGLPDKQCGMVPQIIHPDFLKRTRPSSQKVSWHHAKLVQAQRSLSPKEKESSCVSLCRRSISMSKCIKS